MRWSAGEWIFRQMQMQISKVYWSKSRNLHAADGGKDIARRAAELCGDALNLFFSEVPQ